MAHHTYRQTLWGRNVIYQEKKFYKWKKNKNALTLKADKKGRY
jgi:hypothetical protein